MNDEKSGSSFKTFEEREEMFWTGIVENLRPISRNGYAEAMMVRGNERLKRATEANLEAIEKLRTSMERSSNEANNLASAIKKLTGWLVGLTVAAVVLAAVSLYVLWISTK
jgi:hypothetical protein